MKNAVIILLLLIVFASCKTVSHVQSQQLRTATVDSVTYLEKQVAVPFYVPGDTVMISVPVNCDSLNRVVPFTAQSTGKRSAITANADKGYITVYSYFKGYMDSIWRRDVYISELTSRLDSVAYLKKETVEVRYIPKAYKWAMGFTVGSLLLLLIYIIFRTLKFYYKWQLPI